MLNFVARKDSDEFYVLDLCDELIGEPGSRQHMFDWLLGDPSPKTGKSRRLPVDAYWPNINLVVEYRERQHYEEVGHFDKPDRLTVSGVHRGIQRRLYDERREHEIPSHGLRLVIIKASDLHASPNGRLKRNVDADRATIAQFLGF